MHLIVGLGNPGAKYSETRHNAGFWFIEALARKTGASLSPQSRMNCETARCELHGRPVVLARPSLFMNESGLPVRQLLDFYKLTPADMLVAYDELDLEPGDIRLKQGGGHGGHNGLRDLFRHLPGTDFTRLRIGIGHPGHKDRVTGYVLGRPTADQRIEMERAIDRALPALAPWLDGQLGRAQTQLHTRPEAG